MSSVARSASRSSADAALVSLGDAVLDLHGRLQARHLLAHPDILLLDEPSLGLAPAVAAELFGQFARLRDEGMTLLIVDQMADHVLAIADRGYVLGGGRVVAQGRAAELRGAMLDDAYLGAFPEAVN